MHHSHAMLFNTSVIPFPRKINQTTKKIVTIMTSEDDLFLEIGALRSQSSSTHHAVT